MAIWDWFRPQQTAIAPRSAVQSAGPGVLVTTSEQLAAVLRGSAVSGSGPVVTPSTAMTVASVYACVRIISGAAATLPVHIKRRVDDRTREDASDHALWQVIRRKPNRWQTPVQFKRMLTAHVLLRGNAYALIVRSMGKVLELVPLMADRVEVRQNADLSLTYIYTRKDGRRIELAQSDVMHLSGLSLDGITGVSPLTFARETIGLSLAMESHGATMFKNGAKVSGILSHPGELGKEGQDNLRASLSAFREGGDKEGQELILEEGMGYTQMALSAEDAQWIESRKFTRSDIAMFFGVPPHMIGDTEKSTSWGTGIEQQSIGFVQYTLEEYLTMWEESLNRDLLDPARAADRDLYFRFNRAALVKGDIKTRWESHVKALQWGVMSPNEVRALEDENPRDGGDEYYLPPNTAGTPDPGKDPANDPPTDP